jgi:hypothetical protein
VLRRVAASRDAAAIRTVVPRIRPLGNISTLFFMGGVAFGIVAALTGQINLLAPWLLFSYAAFVGATVISVLVTDPWAARLEAAAIASADGGSSEALGAVVRDPVARAGTWALMVLIPHGGEAVRVRPRHGSSASAYDATVRPAPSAPGDLGFFFDIFEGVLACTGTDRSDPSLAVAVGQGLRNWSVIAVEIDGVGGQESRTSGPSAWRRPVRSGSPRRRSTDVATCSARPAGRRTLPTTPSTS